MEMQRNSRQIPSDMNITSKKDYYDILYGYLQHISTRDPKTGERYVEKSQVVISKLCSKENDSIFAGKISRQTLSKRFNILLETGLLEEDEKHKRYILKTLDKSAAALLPDNTVRILCNTLQDRCLSVLSYFIKTWFQHDQQPFYFTFDYLKSYVGLSVKDKNKNNQVIKDILIVLQKLGLIKYTVEHIYVQETGCVKTLYKITDVDNEVNLCECD